jgi:hypothetical protein
MKRRVSLVVAGVLAVAATAEAQTLSLKLEGGRVTLNAQNVSVTEILRQWAKVGGATVLNGDQIQSGPVSLEFVNVPERAALETVLRGVSGYILVGRQAAGAASTIDRILIVPVSVPPRSESSVTSPALRPPSESRRRTYAPTPEPAATYPGDEQPGVGNALEQSP